MSSPQPRWSDGGRRRSGGGGAEAWGLGVGDGGLCRAGASAMGTAQDRRLQTREDAGKSFREWTGLRGEVGLGEVVWVE